MKNQINKVFILILIITTSLNLYCGSKEVENTSDISIYFTIPDNDCTTCCMTAISYYLDNFSKVLDVKKYLIISKYDKNLIKYLNNKLTIDSIVINDNIDSFNNIRFKSPYDIIVFDKNGTLVSQTSNYKLIQPQILKKIKKVNCFVHNFTNNNSTFIASVANPSFHKDKNQILFIDPLQNSIVNYNIKKDSITNMFQPSKEDKYTYYPTEIKKQKKWDQLYKYYKDYIQYYSIISVNNDNTTSLISIKNDFYFDSTAKTHTIQAILAIFKQFKDKKSIIKPLLGNDFYYDYTRTILANDINDTIKLIPIIQHSKTKKNDKHIVNKHIGFLNRYSNSIHFNSQIDSIFQVDSSSLFIAANHKNNFFILKNRILSKYNYTSDSISSINNKEVNIDLNWQNNIFDILVNNSKVYILFFHTNKKNQIYLYMEEYNESDLSFIKGYSLSWNALETQDVILAGINKDDLFLFIKDTEGEWKLISFNIP